MRILGLNVGHDACSALFENGRCTWHEDLARTLRRKHAALRFGRGAWTWATDTWRALNPDVTVATLNPGDAEEFALMLARLEALPPFEGCTRAAASAWEALRACGTFRAGESAWLLEHGLAHAWSAWLTSPFAHQARVLAISLDGWSTFGHDTVVEIVSGEPGPIRRGVFPIGGAFFDQYLATLLFGEASLGAPGKIMGFAQLGEPRAPYGTFLEETAPAFATAAASYREQALRMEAWARETVGRFPELQRSPGFERRSTVQDFFASAQAFFTDAIVDVIVALARESGCAGVAYAGGCALSIVTNDRLVRALDVPLHIVPCANDSGQAFGAAAWGDLHFNGLVPPIVRFDPFVGAQAGGDREPPQPAPLDVDALADELAGGALLGWFRGRHALGPRALGDRSVLASPAIPGMQDRLNGEVKHREWYRPYGAICLDSDVDEVFEDGRPSPYMLHSFRVREPFRALTRECCSASGWCRLQTVNDDSHPDLCALLRAFRRRTGCPLLINTSLNRGGLPIVSTIDHALDDAAAMGLDGIVWVNSSGQSGTRL